MDAGKLFKELQGYSRSREFESLFKRVLDAANQAAQAAAEAEQRKSQLQKQIADLKAEAGTLEQDRIAQRDAISREMEAQRQQAIRSLVDEKRIHEAEIESAVQAKEQAWREAKAEAAKLQTVTEETSRQIAAQADRLSAARKLAEEAMAKLDADLEQARKVHASMLAELHEREAEAMQFLETTRKAKQAEVDSLDAKLASLRETARKLAGG